MQNKHDFGRVENPWNLVNKEHLTSDNFCTLFFNEYVEMWISESRKDETNFHWQKPLRTGEIYGSVQ